MVLEQNVIENNYKIQYHIALLGGGCSTFNFIQYLFKIVVFPFSFTWEGIINEFDKNPPSKRVSNSRKRNKNKITST